MGEVWGCDEERGSGRKKLELVKGRDNEAEWISLTSSSEM